MEITYFDARRAVEALRSGVPNSTAIELLGCSQTRLIENFDGALSAVQVGGTTVGGSASLLIKGGFGSGKSHTLRYLSARARRKNFVVSRVSINKEIPLYDPSKLFRALSDAASLPGRRGIGLYEASQKLVGGGLPYRELQDWVVGQVGLDTRFGASLDLFKSARRDFEMKDRLVRFWCGDTLLPSQIQIAVRQLGLPRIPSFNTRSLRDLGYQRAQFASRMLRSAGYAGWVWLVDEIELIGCYGLIQRAKSYAEIGRLLTGGSELDCPGVVVVLAITDDFEAAVLRGKQDLMSIPSLWSERSNLHKEERKHSPLVGMKAIQRNGILLEPLSTAEIDRLHATVRQLYFSAYEWLPPENGHAPGVASSTVRQRIKRWLTEWDIARLCSTTSLDIVEDVLKPTYTEVVDSEDDGASNDNDLIDEILDIL